MREPTHDADPFWGDIYDAMMSVATRMARSWLADDLPLDYERMAGELRCLALACQPGRGVIQ
jgi:hypothetical protein